MARPGTPSSLDGADPAVPRPPAPRSNSRGKSSGYKLFPSVEPTPPTSPASLQKLSLSRASSSGPLRTRSVSFDSTARIAAEQQNAGARTVAVRRGRKSSVPEVKYMSTLQEIPSPTVSIPYSFLPRSSEDASHARSSSAPGEFVRDSQTLPISRIDLSKPQWTSKQADSHPARGLGLSMPASMSADRLDQRREPPSAKPKPNLTIEIKHDARLKPKAIVVRGEDVDALDDKLPPPPPPKSPRYDSRNHSLNNIAYEPRKVRRTRSRTASRSSSRQSHETPDSAHPSEEATVAAQGSFVKAALVDTPSPSTPAPAKPVISHGRQGSFSPLSGDMRIKELMATTRTDGEDDLERPIPPPITPGQPRVASMARVVSIPSLPKAVSVEKPATKQGSEERREKTAFSSSETKSTETIVSARPADERTQKLGKAGTSTEGEAEDSCKMKHPGQDRQLDTTPSVSPAVSSATSKSTSTKTSKPNLDKPMPSLPPPSSRLSEHMRQVRAAKTGDSEDAPPVPELQPAKSRRDGEKENPEGKTEESSTGKPVQVSAGQTKTDVHTARRPALPTEEEVNKQEPPKAAQTPVRRAESADRDGGRVAKGGGLSAFPSVPPPPRYYGRGTREESPPAAAPMTQRLPPRDSGPQRPGRDASQGQRLVPGPASNRPAYPSFMPNERAMGKGPPPPRSRFYGRQPESANNSQTSLVDRPPRSETREAEATRSAVASPEPRLRTMSPASHARSTPPPVQTPPIEQRITPVLETKVDAAKHPQTQRPRHDSNGKATASETKTDLLNPREKAQTQDLLKRPSSPANMGRAPSPTPSLRPSHAGDLLDKSSSDKSLPSLPPEPGPRPTTPDAGSMLTFDTKPAMPDPVQTLRDLTKQSEALHARHASLRADRLKLSTAISASLKDSKPGPEYANLLLDQHLSLNAINSSLDICFAKLKSLDCKKEEAIQALVEQTKRRQSHERRHKHTASVATHSTQASISGQSSKASTPDVGSGPLPPLQEREPRGHAPSTASVASSHMRIQSHDSNVRSVKENKAMQSAAEDDADDERASLADGLPTPRAVPPTKNPPRTEANEPPSQQPISTTSASVTQPEQKRNTMVKMPTISPAPSLFTKDLVEMSPVSPIEDNDNDSINLPRRITIKGAKAAKILGLVAGRSESASGITLPDASPTETRGSPGKELAVELKIQRKPVPSTTARTAAPPPSARQAPVPPQPGHKRTNDSASTVQTDSSPESEVRTPRGSQEDMVPRGLKIGKKAPPPQLVQVFNDDDILDYYSR